MAAEISHHFEGPLIENPQEKCGVVFGRSKIGEPFGPTLSQNLATVQHRGYDAAGMSTYRTREMPANAGSHRLLTSEPVVHPQNSPTTIPHISTFNGPGLVAEVFGEGFDFNARGLDGDAGHAHVRYGTSGDEKDAPDGAQPKIAKHEDKTVSLSFNGNVNKQGMDILANKIPEGMPPTGGLDTNYIAQAIVSAPGESWPERIKAAMDGVDFAYAFSALVQEGDRPVEQYALAGPTDTWQLWTQETDNKIEGASEIRKPKDGNLEGIRKVKPGELIQITDSGIESIQLFTPDISARCTVQDGYGADANSLMTENGDTFGDFRIELGRSLAEINPVEGDFYVPIPDSGKYFAQGYAEGMGKQLTPIIQKRGGRSYIAKSIEEAADIVDKKYSISDEFADLVPDADIITLDDSLIKGTSTGGHPLDTPFDDPLKRTAGYNGLLRRNGAKSVKNVFSLGKFVNGCDGGYVIREDQLVARLKQPDGTYIELNEAQIADRIGADLVVLNKVSAIKETYKKFFGSPDVACMNCMGEEHPLDRIRKVREERAQLSNPRSTVEEPELAVA